MAVYNYLSYSLSCGFAPSAGATSGGRKFEIARNTEADLVIQGDIFSALITAMLQKATEHWTRKMLVDISVTLSCILIQRPGGLVPPGVIRIKSFSPYPSNDFWRMRVEEATIQPYQPYVRVNIKYSQVYKYYLTYRSFDQFILDFPADSALIAEKIHWQYTTGADHVLRGLLYRHTTTIKIDLRKPPG